MYNRDFLAAVKIEESERFLVDLFSQTKDCDPGVRAMRADMASYLPGDLLAKVDITSMAHGLECRSPFMDHKVVETACKIPYSILSNAGKVKPCLTKTFANLIPENLQNRPKMGFSVPLDKWFRTDLNVFARETLMASDAFCHRYLKREAIAKILTDHDSGRWSNGDRIWSLLFLELWGRSATKAPNAA